MTATISKISLKRREAERLQTRLRADYCPLVAHGGGLRVGGLQRGVATNLSESGLFIADVGYLKVGALVHLFLRLPDIPANPIVCYARVVRRGLGREQGYGLRFLRLPERDAARIRCFVDGLRSFGARAVA